MYVQQKTVGYGEDLGGSMPTLNHDFTNGSVKSIDLQVLLVLERFIVI